MASSSEINASTGEIQLVEHHAVDINATSPPPLQQLKLPRQDLFSHARRDEFSEICSALYKASREGNWRASKTILDGRNELVRFSINRYNETALHVAAYEGKSTVFVENLVSLMTNYDLELQNNSSNNALCLAAERGHVAIAKILVTKHKGLLNMTGCHEKMPLHMAAESKRHHMSVYLYEMSKKMTGDLWTNESRGGVLLACIQAELFDVALQIVKDRPELALSEASILALLARKPRALRKDYTLFQLFRINLYYWMPYVVSGCLQSRWQFMKQVKIRIEVLLDNRFGGIDVGKEAVQLLWIILANIVKLPDTKIDDILRGPVDKIMEGEMLEEACTKYSSRVLFLATEMGNTAFVAEILREYPEAVLELNDKKQSIFHVAISYRRGGIFRMLHRIGSMKNLLINLEDADGNNMLHLVGILKETTIGYQYPDVRLPVFRMRSELEWYQVVKDLLPPSLREKKNKAGLRPHDLFTKNHNELVSETVESVKKIVSKLLVAATLIATISFAAAITFAGGYKQDIGKPIFSGNKSFDAFMLCNGMSFILAFASIFHGMSIIGASYGQHHLFSTLLMKLRSVLLLLSASMIFLTSAFSINFFLLYKDASKVVPYIMTSFSIMLGCLLMYTVVTS